MNVEYVEQMQSLITKTTINIAIILAIIAVMIGVIWIVPLSYYIKHKNDKKKAIKAKKASLIAQITLTTVCLLFSLTTISSFRDIDNMKKDIEEQTFITYSGNYDADNTSHLTFSVSELWFDLRTVTIDTDSEPLWFDLTSDIDINSGGTGTIVYGKNSRYVVKIESSR